MTLKRWMILAPFATAIAACGGSSSNPTTPVTYPVIIITNSWVEEGDSSHVFLLASSNDGSATGTFTGEESSGVDTFELAGTWDRGVIRFTVQRATPVAYEASFSSDNPTRLEFSSSAGPLVLIQSSS